MDTKIEKGIESWCHVVVVEFVWAKIHYGCLATNADTGHHAMPAYDNLGI